MNGVITPEIWLVRWQTVNHLHALCQLSNTVLRANGDIPEAMRALSEALDIAEAEGFGAAMASGDQLANSACEMVYEMAALLARIALTDESDALLVRARALRAMQ